MVKKYTDRGYDIVKHLPDEEYYHWDQFIEGDHNYISNSWNSWDKSILDVKPDAEGAGPSSSSLINGRPIVVEYE